MNTVNLIGRLTRPAELRYTASGKAVSNATLAVNRKFKRDEADFINLVAWEKTAELMANNLDKGSRIGIEGRIETGSYEKDGRKVYTTDVVVDQLHFLDSKSDRKDDQQGGGRPQEQSNERWREQGGPIEVTDDMLPF